MLLQEDDLLALDQYKLLNLEQKAQYDQYCLQNGVTEAIKNVVSFCIDYERAFGEQKYFRDHGENSKTPSELGLTDRFLITLAANYRHPKPGKLMMVSFKLCVGAFA